MRPSPALDSAKNAFDNGFGKWPMMTVREAGASWIFISGQSKKDEIVSLIMMSTCRHEEFDRTVS